MAEYVITITGDTSFGESYKVRVDGKNLIKSKGRAYSLQGVAPLLRTSDLVIANLETPLTSHRNSPIAESKVYVHWSDEVESPRVLREHNIGVVSLANNHTLDCGVEALLETFESLDRNQIEWFGAGRNALEARRPYRKGIAVGAQTVPLAVIGAYEYRPHYQRKYRFYAKSDTPGVNRLATRRIADQIAELKRETPRPFVILFPHWGGNYVWHTPKQARQARAMAEAGADLIIGHGAHMLGGIERAGAAWTLYSLGNFVFNSPGRYAGLNAPPYSLVAHLIMGARAESVSVQIRLYPILTDNKRTAYQSRPVNEQEIVEVARLLETRSASVPAETFEPKRDDFGFYFELPISARTGL